MIRQGLAVLAVGMCLFGSGCRFERQKEADRENVKIATPFGGMQVKTNDAAVQTGLGLPTYPGATLQKKGKDHGSADVNMSFGSFQLRVKAVTYRTDDSPEQVEAFYRKELGRFGDVLTCSDNHAVGVPVKTAEGLTCEKGRDKHVVLDRDENSVNRELKAGSQQHQHIVSLERDGDGTKFGLVALDLPGHISIGEKDDEAKQ